MSKADEDIADLMKAFDREFLHANLNWRVHEKFSADGQNPPSSDCLKMLAGLALADASEMIL